MNMSYYNRNTKDRFTYEDDWLRQHKRKEYLEEPYTVSYCDNRHVIAGVPWNSGKGYKVDYEYIKLLLEL